jgi:hypothetical protein
MGMRAEWRGVWLGIGFGALGAGVLVIWHTDLAGWVFIAVGIGTISGSLLHLYSNFRYSIIFGAMMFLAVVVIGAVSQKYIGNTANIEFQKFALFWIDQGQERYQLGIVGRFFNEDPISYRVASIKFEGGGSKWTPRGGYYIKEYAVFPDTLDIIINDELSAGSTKYIKHLLPVFFDMHIIGGKTMDVTFINPKWVMILDKFSITIDPRFYCVYDRIISTNEWSSLLTTSSKIDIETLPYVQIGSEN